MTRAALTRAGLVVVCALLTVSGCQSAAPPTPPPTPRPVTASTPQSPAAAPPTAALRQTLASSAVPRAPYIDMVDVVAGRGAKVWVEVGLVKAWLDGPQRYADVLNIALTLAARPGVVGVKIADELGYHDGIDTPERAREFLAQASHDIRSRLPRTKILVDMVVPQLGCLAWVAGQSWQAERLDCASSTGSTSPAATIEAIQTYLRAKTFDVLDLSAGLREGATYRRWGTTPDDAMRDAWKEVAHRGWGVLVTLHARKALAHPGSYTAGSAQAEADLHTFVDIPLANGAHGADIWAWRQQYLGELYRLYDPGLHPNALIAGLARRRAAGDNLFTHMSPSSVEVAMPTDVGAATAIFGSIFVAAGAGS